MAPTLPDHLIEEHFVRSPGPGGQNVNKVNTGVELRVDIANAPLPDDLKARLRTLAGHRMTADGILVISAHEHRTQGKNREAARARLDDLLTQAARRPRPRRPTRPTAAARAKRVETKVARGRTKRARARRIDEE